MICGNMRNSPNGMVNKLKIGGIQNEKHFKRRIRAYRKETKYGY